MLISATVYFFPKFLSSFNTRKLPHLGWNSLHWLSFFSVFSFQFFTSCFVTWCGVLGGRIGEVSDKKTNFPHSLPQVASTWIALKKSKYENPISFAVWKDVGLFDKSRSTTWWQDLLEMWARDREVEESLTSCCVRWLKKYGCSGLEMCGELVVGRESTSSNTLVFWVKIYFILNYLF